MLREADFKKKMPSHDETLQRAVAPQEGALGLLGGFGCASAGIISIWTATVDALLTDTYRPLIQGQRSAFLDHLETHQMGHVADGLGVVAVIGDAVQGGVVVLGAGAEGTSTPVG